MQQRTSFFDDDDLTITFEFQKPTQKHEKDLASPPILNTKLQRQFNPHDAPKEGLYMLHNSTLAYYKNGLSTRPESVLSLAHSRLNVLPANSGPYGFGFSVTKNGLKYEFFSPDDQVIQTWAEVLRTVCILTNFHDEYRANKMIGKGSFAKVYLVESKTTNKNYAVKAFTKESVIISNKANAKPCMLNEIGLMRGLDHENVIKLYEVYETEKSIYLVLELIQGKSLQDLLKKATFKENEARTINIISSILEALAYLASKGIMHRDLKPDNILLDKGDKVKIVDFGLATQIDLPEYIFKKCGTPGYIAPEVFKYDQKLPETSYNDKCDAFSAGCILFFMVFGIPFFDGPNASEILKSNRRFGPEFQSTTIVKQEMKNPNSRISKDALQLLLQLLEHDQKKRITASQALNHPYIASVVQQKISGAYDVYQYGGFSPSIRDRRSSLAPDSASKTASPGILQQRFVEKDSLYLDLGKPEMNGKVDTLTNGSANNSMLLHKQDHGGSSPHSASPFVNNPMRTSSFKAYAANNQSIYKAAIFKNMQKKNSEDDEENKVESAGAEKNRIQDQRHERRHSDFVVLKGPTFNNTGLFSERGRHGSDDDDIDDEDTDDINENAQLQKNMEKMLRASRIKPSKLAEAPPPKRGLFGWAMKGF